MGLCQWNWCQRGGLNWIPDWYSLSDASRTIFLGNFRSGIKSFSSTRTGPNLKLHFGGFFFRGFWSQTHQPSGFFSELVETIYSKPVFCGPLVTNQDFLIGHKHWNRLILEITGTVSYFLILIVHLFDFERFKSSFPSSLSQASLCLVVLFLLQKIPERQGQRPKEKTKEKPWQNISRCVCQLRLLHLPAPECCTSYS